MKQQASPTDPASYDISTANETFDALSPVSIEEFDALAFKEVHKFSSRYKRQKKKMLRQYRKKLSDTSRHIYAKAAAAAAALAICIPVMADAAVNGRFFNWIWGSLTRHDIKSHSEQLYDEQELPFTHIFPEREYVPVDPDKADDLIGSYISRQPITKKMGDTTLTILSYVSDGSAAIIEFTLERAGGVNAFHYSQLDNEYRGAAFSNDVSFWFHFPACAENIYVDLERSTAERLYCYDYMAMEPDAYDPSAKGILLEIYEYPCAKGELFAADEETFDQYISETKISHITVPLESLAGQAVYVNPDGGTASISPIAIKIDTDKGLGLEEKNEQLYDADNIYYVCIRYKDNSSYLVLEHALMDEYTCDTKIDNSSCISYDSHGNLIIVFNRLVDPGDIVSITINQTIYSLETY